jgi:HAD superfamily hydrolase (TIGR01509 family)
MRCVVLDAMGVLFQAADDVAELLIPFVAQAGGTDDPDAIEAAYLEASVGTIDADEFWRVVGLDPSIEDAYLSRHALVPGAEAFLQYAKRKKIPVWCLSNDVGRWSRKLRTRFDIEDLLAGAVISSDVHARKPSREIYEYLFAQSGFRPEDLFFVDDRAKNVAAALALGIAAEQFEPRIGYRDLLKRPLEAT